jgi:hypothetical protein
MSEMGNGCYATRSVPAAVTNPDLALPSATAGAFGGRLRSRMDAHQAAEMVVAANVLNRMLDLGRPEHVRLA